jgi:hypothetical protein
MWKWLVIFLFFIFHWVLLTPNPYERHKSAGLGAWVLGYQKYLLQVVVQGHTKTISIWDGHSTHDCCSCYSGSCTPHQVRFIMIFHEIVFIVHTACHYLQWGRPWAAKHRCSQHHTMSWHTNSRICPLVWWYKPQNTFKSNLCTN